MKGKNVYELISPDGHVYVMQSYSEEIDKNLNKEGLQTLGIRLKLQKVGKYQVRRLDGDPVVQSVGGIAHVIQDDLQNSYQLMP
jgi:hypothetical protein